MLFILYLDAKFAVKDVTEGAEYEFRVAAINESGSGDLSPPSAMVCAKNPNSTYKSIFTVHINDLTLLSHHILSAALSAFHNL